MAYADAGLSPELVSLVHHIELNKVGWWDRALERLAVAALWLAGKPLAVKAICEECAKDFSMSVDPARLVTRVNLLCDQGILIRLPNAEFKISEKHLEGFERDLKEGESIQNAAKARFVKLLQHYCPSAAAEDTWRTFNEELLIPTVRDLGAKTYRIVSTVGLGVEQGPRFEVFFNSCPGQDRGALIKVVGDFLDPHDAIVRSYVLRYLNVHFFLEAAALSQNSLKALENLPNKPSFTLLLDTNVLFSILGLHDNPSNEAAVLLVALVADHQASVSAKLYACPMTIKEMTDVLLARQEDMKGLTVTPNMVEAAKKAGLSGTTLSLFQQAKGPEGIAASDFFGPYLRDPVRILRSKGVEFYNVKLDDYKMEQSVIDDIAEQMDYEKTRSPRPKEYEAVVHDVVLWHYARDKRPTPVESPADANFWIVTLDFGFLGFDSFKRRQVQDTVPICIHPSTLISMLQFWVPRETIFDEAMVGALRLPFLFQDFDPQAERVTVRILQVLSRFENIRDLSEETILNILLSDALRHKISAETQTEQQIRLIEQALIEEHSKLKKALDESTVRIGQLQKSDSEKDLIIAALKDQVERESSQRGILQTEAETARRELMSEKEARKSLELRITDLEKAEHAQGTKGLQRRFLISWGIGAPLLVGAASWLTDLFGHHSWRIDAITVSLLVVCWVWLASWDGNRKAEVKGTSAFKRFLTAKNWLFGILGALALGVAANALWEALK